MRSHSFAPSVNVLIVFLAIFFYPSVCFSTTVIVKENDKETARWEEADGLNQMKTVDSKGNVLSLEKAKPFDSSVSGGNSASASQDNDKALFGGVCIGDDMKTAAINLRKSGFSDINFQEENEFISLDTEINSTRLDIVLSFEDGNAWSATFSTYPHDADQFNRMIQQDWETLVKLIETRYGPAKYSKEYPNFLSVVNGSYETHRWVLGKKIIYINVEERQATCTMFDSDVNEKIGKRRREKENSEISKAASNLF